MIDDELALELAWQGAIDAQRYMTRASAGGVLHEESGLLLYAGPTPMPFLENGVVRTDARVPPDDVIERARTFFEPRNRGFSVLALTGPDDDLAAAAVAQGFMSFGDPSPVMVIDEPPESVTVPAGVRIERVTTEPDVEALADICSDAYAVYGMPANVAPAVHSPPSILLSPHIAAVLAYDDEGPVATATAVATYGTSYVQWVGTRQRAFGRGIGAAVTEAVTIAGFELGARLATLGASPMGTPVYRRLGWRDVGTSQTLMTFTAR